MKKNTEILYFTIKTTQERIKNESVELPSTIPCSDTFAIGDNREYRGNNWTDLNFDKTTEMARKFCIIYIQILSDHFWPFTKGKTTWDYFRVHAVLWYLKPYIIARDIYLLQTKKAFNSYLKHQYMLNSIKQYIYWLKWSINKHDYHKIHLLQIFIYHMY